MLSPSWWSRQGLAARIGLMGVALVLTAAVVLAVLLSALGQQRSATASARSSRGISTALEALQLDALEMESGVRGYVITRSDSLLAPYRAARVRFAADSAQIEPRLAARPRERAAVAAIARDLERYVLASAQPLISRAAAARNRGVPIAAITREAALIESLRARLRTLETAEASQLAARRAAADSAASRAVVAAIAGFAALALLMALAVLYLQRAVARPVRQVAGAAERLAAGDYEARAPAAGGGDVLGLESTFNEMAASLAETHGRLGGENTELEAQRGELVAAVGRLGLEKSRVERFLRFGRDLGAETEVETVARTIVEELRELAGADRAALYLEDPHEPGAARLIATAGATGESVPAVGSVAALGPPQISRAGDELRAPLHTGGRQLGTLVLARGEGRFAAAAVETVGDLAVQSSVALASALSLRSARQAASLVRAVLDATPDAIAFHDVAGEVVLENRPMVAVRAELDEAAGPGTPLEDDEPTDPEDELRDELGLAGSHRRFARFAGPVRDASGIMLGRLVALRDITAERDAERVKNEFFGMVSHELRTPLTSIIGYLELVLDDDEGTLDAVHRDFLSVADRNARRLLRLVGDLLFVAQVEAGTLTLEPAPVELATVAMQAVETFTPRAAARGIELTAELDAVPLLQGDADRLSQVVENLLANALKFTPTGGRVQVLLHAGDESAVLEVVDSGPGIAPADQARLFERFFRTEAAVSAAVEGTGLGLAIVRAIVDGHSGRISVQSAEGAGARFIVELPLAAQPAPTGGL